MKLVVGRAMLWALAGVAIGLCGAFVLARLIASMLYQVRPSDPLSYIAVSAILMAVAFLASYVPARRATRVDPMQALRQ